MKYKNRQAYKGDCRNADIAIYIEELDKFIYERYKFGDVFLETIGHPDNDDGYDLFIVEGEIENKKLLEKVNGKEGRDLINYELKYRQKELIKKIMKDDENDGLYD
jgi:hypothetical protein